MASKKPGSQREPLFVVDDPIPEPKASKEYVPNWAKPTPRSILNATDAKAIEIVNRLIREAALERIGGDESLLTVPSTEANRRKIWTANKTKTKRVMRKLWPKKMGTGGKKRLVTIFSGQFADVPLEEFVAFAKNAGFQGVELACWHINIQRVLVDPEYRQWIAAIFAKYDMKLVAISTHLVGQCVLDRVDERHEDILFAAKHVWGDGNKHGVNMRAALEMMDTAAAAKLLGVQVVNGFTGSSVWHLVYDFPPAKPGMIQGGFDLLAARWNPILDVFKLFGIYFALEVHPTEIAFDIATAERALQALDYRPEFGFNFDPSHLIWQGTDPAEFIRYFAERIYHVHMKDAFAKLGTFRSVLASYLPFGHPGRGFDFVSLGRGHVNFTEIIRALNAADYFGPLSNEWEDSGMDREQGAREAANYIHTVDFGKSDRRMDAAFADSTTVA